MSGNQPEEFSDITFLMYLYVNLSNDYIMELLFGSLLALYDCSKYECGILDYVCQITCPFVSQPHLDVRNDNPCLVVAKVI